MNFTDYSQENEILVLNSDTSAADPSASVFNTSNLTSVKSKTQPVAVTVNRSIKDTELEYSFQSLIPEGSKVLKKNITIYGEKEGQRTVANLNNNLSRKLFIDNVYQNLEANVEIEYQDISSGKLMSLKQDFKLDSSKNVSLNLTDMSVPSFSSSAEDQVELINFLVRKIEGLESRIYDLESQ